MLLLYEKSEGDEKGVRTLSTFANTSAPIGWWPVGFGLVPFGPGIFLPLWLPSSRLVRMCSLALLKASLMGYLPFWYQKPRTGSGRFRTLSSKHVL